MIRSDIDPGAVRRALDSAGRTQIRDFLLPSSADRLHRCLAEEVPWSLAFCDESGSRTLPVETYSAMPQTERETLFRTLAVSAAGGTYRFAYDCYLMLRAYLEGRDPGLLLHPLLDFFNSAQYLHFARLLSGISGIRRVTAQATAYRPGQFLCMHSDIDSTEGREVAFVLNLSRDWKADWGGLLHFVGPDGTVVETFMPRWNALSLFRVPTDHFVSMVMPWAEQERLAITGWFLSN
jgi:Rps23 Pro-64 3,4-dihydroxylase Tpa1-like proline 4-hydroxylase